MNWWAVTLGGICITAGSLATILMKVLLEQTIDENSCSGVGHGVFSKPVFVTLVVFVGQGCTLLAPVVSAAFSACAPRAARSHGASVNAASAANAQPQAGGSLTSSPAFQPANGSDGRRSVSCSVPAGKAQAMQDLALGSTHKDAAGGGSGGGGSGGGYSKLDGGYSKLDGGYSKLDDGDAKPAAAAAPTVPWCKYTPLILPATMDVLASIAVLSGLALLPASAFTILRGSLVVFTVLTKWLFGSRFGLNKVTRHEVQSAVITIGALVLVFLSTVLATHTGHDTGSGSYSVLGVIGGTLLVLLSGVLSAAQFLLESAYLEADTFTTAEQNGVEGVVGAVELVVLLVVLQLLPVGFDSQNGHLEDSMETIHMLGCDPQLWWFIAGIVLCLSAFTVTLMASGRLFGSVFRSVLCVVRVAAVWALDLVLYYGITRRKYGETVTYYSLIELAGCGFLFWGIYVASKGAKDHATPVEADPEAASTKPLLPDKDRHDHGGSVSVGRTPFMASAARTMSN